MANASSRHISRVKDQTRQRQQLDNLAEELINYHGGIKDYSPTYDFRNDSIVYLRRRSCLFTRLARYGHVGILPDRE